MSTISLERLNDIVKVETNAESLNGIPIEDVALDEVNRRLIAALLADARCPISELARAVGMSTPAVRARLRKLEDSGVIRGYRLDVDPAAVGLPVSAWVRVRPGPGQLTRLAELAADTPEVSECHRVTGEDCFLLRVHVPTVESLENVLDRFLAGGQTNSAIIVSTPVPPRAVIPSTTLPRPS